MADKKTAKTKAVETPVRARARGKGPPPVVRPEGTKMMAVRMTPEMTADLEYIKSHMVAEGYDPTLAAAVRVALRQLRRRLEAGETMTVAKEG